MRNDEFKKQILDLRSQGFSLNEIKRKLKCSKGTVSYHIRREQKGELSLHERKLNRVTDMINSKEYKNRSIPKIRSWVKKYLIQEYGYKCMMCGLGEWLDKPIMLITDHIDGDTKNNELENFRIICSNCDSTLPTFKSKNIIYQKNKNEG